MFCNDDLNVDHFMGFYKGQVEINHKVVEKTSPTLTQHQVIKLPELNK